MKRLTRFTTLLLALMTVLMMSQVAFARESTVKAGTFTYNGSSIKVTDTDEIADAISGMEPGDTITFEQTYTNNSDKTTEWYLKNDVIKTLESGNDASNGGYTYILTSGGQEIFNSSQVGGSDAPDAGGKEGLQLATDATDEWIHIDKLASKASGKTTLVISLDGESQANAYKSREAILALQYAVEDEAVGETVVQHVKGKGVSTGDETNIMIPIAISLGSLLLLVLAIISYRKDRKDGEKA